MRKALLYLIPFVVLMTSCSDGSTHNFAPPVFQAIISPPPTPPVTAAAVVAPPGVLLPTPTVAGEPGEPDSFNASQTEILVTPPPTPESPDSGSAPGVISDVAVDGEFTLGAAPGVPESIVDAARGLAQAVPHLFSWTEVDPANPTADVLLTVNDGTPLAGWVYAVAVPFATVTDETAWTSVTEGWQAGVSALGQLMVDSETAAALTATWGPSATVQVVNDDFIGQVWAARPSWIIVPFERLRPEFKVIPIDGRSPLSRDFDLSTYPLVLPITIKGQPQAVETFLANWTGPAINYDPDKLTRVAMTGVTALVRATAAQMERNGIQWPGEEVAPILRDADFAHVSNEVSFAADCPPPDPYGGTTFCSRDPYFELLESIGANVIELTGNHVNDYGRDPMKRSLDMYAAAGMEWFGGGHDLADAQRALLIDHNNNRIAFVGCNPVGPANAWALADAAGSRPCGPDLLDQISRLRDEGYVVIATLQYIEHYVYHAPPDQQRAFAELAAAGATAVSGSQAHHAQGFAFENGSFIHYGLGNLFFDQMDMMGTRQTFIDTYYIYDGRLLNIDLWTGLIESWARPRVMTPEERADLLRTVFAASGW
jgi:hypothetical protein